MEAFAWIVGIAVVVVGFVAGITALDNYDTTQTLKINNARCSEVAKQAGTTDYKVNYRGECNFVSNGKLVQIDIN